MKTKILTAVASLTLTQAAFAGTDIFFNPLTQSGVVAAANNPVEKNSPWLVPAGLSQVNLTSLDEIEADVAQSVVRVPGTGTSASMIDMLAFDDEGENLFLPHETPFGAGVTRYNMANDFAETLFRGDQGGAAGNWTNDYGAFDPATRVGWKYFPRCRAWRYLNRSAAPPAGITAVTIKDLSRKSPGDVRFAVRGRRGAYPVDATRLPLAGLLVLDPPTAETGQCGQATFPGPAPSCTSDTWAVVCK